MDLKFQAKLRAEVRADQRVVDGISVFLNDKFLTGNNQKYMKMYDWMSKGYDLAETIVGRLKYGNAISKMRSELLSKLEWRDNCSVLYVSIGTGKDLQFIPDWINKRTLDIVGADISMGMLRKCRKKYEHRLNLSLVNCCAEDLPFMDRQFDVVFHVGGINFFNDKALAIQEMIRVAKEDAKILIADETADYLEKQYKKSRLSKKYFQDVSFDFEEIVSAIPSNARELETELMWKNKFYCITFRK